MKIAMGSDHAGFTYKEKIKQLITELGQAVDDLAPIRKRQSTTRSLSAR
jgi:ribose 5-phosphate isomerase RpiB